MYIITVIKKALQFKFINGFINKLFVCSYLVLFKFITTLIIKSSQIYHSNEFSL